MNGLISWMASKLFPPRLCNLRIVDRSHLQDVLSGQSRRERTRPWEEREEFGQWVLCSSCRGAGYVRTEDSQ